MKARKIPPWGQWLLIALLIRVIAALDHASWAHPDEWYQTLEFANLHVNGFALYSQEITLHLRNQSWPFLLAIPLWIAKLVSPESVGLRVFLAQLLAGALDLGVLWGLAGMLQGFARKLEISDRGKHFAFALFVLPYFLAQDSIRLSGEHLSAVLAWISLGFLARGRFAAAGFFAIGILAMKYPAALLTLGFSLGVAVYCLRARDRRSALRYVAGLVAGAIVFGLPDWAVYGRPWESFWMYLQYNVFTGSAALHFGRQPVAAYLEFFTYRWIRFLFPLGIALAFGAWVGLRAGLRALEPWALGLALYLLGHLLVGHKEPRFMYPAEGLLLWAAIAGWIETAQTHLDPRLKELWSRSRALRRVIAGAAIVVFAVNLAFFYKALWGDNWTLNGTYLEVNRHLREAAPVCAVVTSRPLSSVFMLSKPIGYFGAERHEPSFAQAASHPLIWIEREPICPAGEGILLQVDRPDAGWDAQGCALLPSGLLAVLPRDRWEWALKKGFASGVWYRCPPEALAVFREKLVEEPFVRTVGHFPSLPPLGISSSALSSEAKRYSPQPRCQWTCNPIGPDL